MSNMTDEQRERVQRTKERLTAQLPDLKVSHRVRKLAKGDRLYFHVEQQSSLGGGFDSKRMKLARKIIEDMWPDAMMTSGGMTDCTIAAEWLTTNEPSPEQYHRQQIKQAVQYLKEYINTYTNQHYYTDYPYKTLIGDIVYGLGVAVGGDKFSGPDGYRRWCYVLRNVIDGFEEFAPTVEEVDQLINGSYDPKFGDERVCKCGHTYERHFDSYDEMAPIGCKYCDGVECPAFEEDR